MQVKKNPQLDAKNKPAASTTTMQAKKNPQLDAKNKPAASTTTMQVKKNPQLDAKNKPAASPTTIQAKKNPQLDAKNKPAASTTTVQVKPNPKFDALKKRLAYSAKNIPPTKKRKFGVGTLLEITGVGTLLEIPGVKTLLKITVVGMILGNLAAIVFPPFLSCGGKAKQSEAKQYVSSMNKGQQAYFAEKGTFATSLDALGLGLQAQTNNYKYSISATKNVAFSYGVARSNNLLSYVGAVFLLPVSPYNEMTTVAILCQANSRGKIQLPNPIVQNNVLVCAAGTEQVTK